MHQPMNVSKYGLQNADFVETILQNKRRLAKRLDKNKITMRENRRKNEVKTNAQIYIINKINSPEEWCSETKVNKDLMKKAAFVSVNMCVFEQNASPGIT